MELDHWNKVSMLRPRQQGPEEEGDKYVFEARVVPITDTAMLQIAIIRWLRPYIRLHVLQLSPTSIDDVLRAVRVAETANSGKLTGVGSQQTGH